MKIFKTVDVTKTSDVRNESHRIPDSVGRKEEGHARKLNPCLAHGQLGNCFCAVTAQWYFLVCCSPLFLLHYSHLTAAALLIKMWMQNTREASEWHTRKDTWNQIINKIICLSVILDIFLDIFKTDAILLLSGLRIRFIDQYYYFVFQTHETNRFPNIHVQSHIYEALLT